MLHAISGEYFQAAVVELHRDVDDDFPRRGSQHLAHAIIKTKTTGRFVEAGLGGQTRVKLVRDSVYGFECRGRRQSRRRRRGFRDHMRAPPPLSNTSYKEQRYD